MRAVACLVSDSLWNVTIACGMLLLLVECYYCLWNVTIACGMLLRKFNVDAKQLRSSPERAIYLPRVGQKLEA